MLDDLDHLRADAPLLALLTRYAELAEPNRETWHPRITSLGGVESPDLVRLHGGLIAFQWIELNIGEVPCAYRVTLAGLRALRQMQSTVDEMEATPGVETEKQAA